MAPSWQEGCWSENSASASPSDMEGSAELGLGRVCSSSSWEATSTCCLLCRLDSLFIFPLLGTDLRALVRRVEYGEGATVLFMLCSAPGLEFHPLYVRCGLGQSLTPL